MKKILFIAMLLSTLMIVAPTVNAQLFTIENVTLDGQPVHATANFDINYVDDTITITINNLIVNPKSIIQNVSGLGFALEDNGIPITSAASLSSSWAEDFREVQSGGSYSTYDASSGTGWELANSIVFPFGTGYELYVLGTQPKPADNTLIGKPDGTTDLYNNANGSITNTAHNQFLYGPAIFNIDFSGSYDLEPENNIIISGVAWYFGTEPKEVVPETSTIFFLGCALFGLGMLRRKFR